MHVQAALEARDFDPDDQCIESATQARAQWPTDVPGPTDAQLSARTPLVMVLGRALADLTAAAHKRSVTWAMP